ncbi:C-X-C motif chemokine 11 isoform X2 [Notamacropus eugenii]
MSLKVLAALLAILLYSPDVHGFLMFRKNRCLCRGPMVNAVNLRNVKNVSIIFPSNSCDKNEIVITPIKDGNKMCLNPESKQGKFILKRAVKKIS